MTYGAKCGWHGGCFAFFRWGQTLPVSLAGQSKPAGDLINRTKREPARILKMTEPTNNPYWEQAVRLFLSDAESIIANPALLSQEENEWMLREASALVAEELE